MHIYVISAATPFSPPKHLLTRVKSEHIWLTTLLKLYLRH